MTQATTPLRAWFGDPDLKEQVVLRLKKHRQQDEIVQGFYQEYSETESGYRGCAVGCTLPPMFKYDKQLFSTQPEGQKRWINPGDQAVWEEDGFHGLIEKYYGVHEQVARLIDNVFEEQDTFEAAGDFAVAVIEAVPVGADLSQVWATFYRLEVEREAEMRDTTPAGSAERRQAYRDHSTWMAKLLIELLSTAPVPESV